MFDCSQYSSTEDGTAAYSSLNQPQAFCIPAMRTKEQQHVSRIQPPPAGTGSLKDRPGLASHIHSASHKAKAIQGLAPSSGRAKTKGLWGGAGGFSSATLLSGGSNHTGSKLNFPISKPKVFQDKALESQSRP